VERADGPLGAPEVVTRDPWGTQIRLRAAASTRRAG